MDIRNLEYFVAVAENSSVSKAAEKLFVSQPTISVAMKRLESELGILLFERKPKKLQLTPAGKVFYERLMPALKGVNEAIKAAASVKGANLDPVIVKLPSMFKNHDLCRKLSESYPNVHWNMEEYKYGELQADIRRGIIDIAITSPCCEGEGLEYAVLNDAEMFAFVPSDHPLANRQSIDLSELRNDSFIAAPDRTGSRIRFESLCEEAGFIPNVIGEAKLSRDMVFAMKVAHCCLVTVFSRDIDDKMLEGVSVLKIDHPYCHAEIGVTWRSSDNNNKLISYLRKVIMDDYAERAKNRAPHDIKRPL